jgi:hypothetical protein
MGLIEDEQQALYDCPMYADLREKFSGLFHDDCRTLIQLYGIDQDYTRLAKFLTFCRERRVQMIATGSSGQTLADNVRTLS